MDYRVIDREFRDYTAELKYPFSDNAVMGSTAGMMLPAGCFLDMILYIPEKLEPPLFLDSVLAGSAEGTADLIIRDVYGEEAAVCTVDPENADTAFFRHKGLEAGCVVYDKQLMRNLVRAARMHPVEFGSNLPVQPGRCFTYRTSYMMGLKDSPAGDRGGTVHTGDVYIVAANGVNFREDAENPGTFFVDLYGEDLERDKFISSVNGVSREHMWFAAHPNSGVKIETESKGIKFRSIKDE